MPHSIISAAAPETKGAAMLVPVNTSYPPPALAERTASAGAVRSRSSRPAHSRSPRPEKGLTVSVSVRKPPTEMGYWAVAGRVMVRSGSGWRKAVRSLTSSTVGSQMSKRPLDTRFP